MWISIKNLLRLHPLSVDKLWINCGQTVDKLWISIKSLLRLHLYL